MCRFGDEKIRGCLDEICRCEDVRMICVDLKMGRYVDVKMIFVDVKMRRCRSEDEKIWR